MTCVLCSQKSKVVLLYSPKMGSKWCAMNNWRRYR